MPVLHRALQRQETRMITPFKGLSFGYLYELRNPPDWHRPWVELYADALEFAVWTEELGFDGAWVPEHHATTDGFSPAPLAMLAAIAGRTKRMKLGTAV